MFTRILSEDIGAIMSIGLLIGGTVALAILFLVFQLLKGSTVRRLAIAILISISVVVIAFWLFITVLGGS
jgi:hypothetical protein